MQSFKPMDGEVGADDRTGILSHPAGAHRVQDIDEETLDPLAGPDRQIRARHRGGKVASHDTVPRAVADVALRHAATVERGPILQGQAVGASPTP